VAVPSTCERPGCDNPTATGARCEQHARRTRRAPDPRPSASQRGYGARWRRIARAFLAANPWCVWPGCARRSEVPDHYPDTRADLIAADVPDPDAPHRLRALCTPHHNQHTALTARRGHV